MNFALKKELPKHVKLKELMKFDLQPLVSLPLSFHIRNTLQNEDVIFLIIIS